MMEASGFSVSFCVPTESFRLIERPSERSRRCSTFTIRCSIISVLFDNRANICCTFCSCGGPRISSFSGCMLVEEDIVNI